MNLFSIKIKKAENELEATIKKINSGSFFCRADAEASVEKTRRTAANCYHRLQSEVRKEIKYPRGRPAKAKARIPTGYEHILDVKIDLDVDAVPPCSQKMNQNSQKRVIKKR
jgi:hypothetical protein